MRRTADTPQRGFTLLEIVVALAVFAVIGVLASRILTGIIDVNEGTRSRGDALFEIQRAMSLIENDLGQITARSIRDELGDRLPAVSVGDNTLIEFTRLGWQNPLGEPRSEAQRVAYAYQDDTLLRLFWPVLDRAPGTEPLVQALLSNVRSVEFIAHDYEGDEHRYWPRVVDADEADRTMLAAVEMRLEVEPYGRIERLWVLAAEPGKRPQDSDSPAAPLLPGINEPEEDEPREEEPKEDEPQEDDEQAPEDAE